MILEVRANQKSFRTVKLQPGLNAILAHRAEETNRRGTRNGLGKTTLLRVVHFCLGGNEKLRDEMKQKSLHDWEFSLELLVGEERVMVTRPVDRPSQVTINAASSWLGKHLIDNPSQPSSQQKMELGNLRGERKLSVNEWRSFLGNDLYDLKSISDDPHPVAFESLLGYDVRLSRFDRPFEYRVNQYRRDVHLCNTYLLGLNWQFASKWEEIKRKDDAVKSDQNALKQDEHYNAETTPTIGELETERDRLQRILKMTDADLSKFRVHPQYEHIETEANNLTRQLHNLSNRILQLKRLIDFHDVSVRQEKPADERQVIELYEEAGSVLSAPIVRRLEDVKAFHFQITRNRREYLRKEVSRLNQELSIAKQKREQLSNRRAELMRVLDTHGAIEEFRRIEQLSDHTRNDLEAVIARIEKLKAIEKETAIIRIEREQLLLDARIDLDEKAAAMKAREVYDRNTEALYETSGNLIVNLNPHSGYNFDVDIARSGSAGVDEMKVFCYDLMRAELWSQRKVRPGFLVHDSSIFANVDERQIARALELADSKSRECGFQYIVCLDSDRIPHDEFTADFDIEKFVRLTLTDDDPSGRLLGIEF